MNSFEMMYHIITYFHFQLLDEVDRVHLESYVIKGHRLSHEDSDNINTNITHLSDLQVAEYLPRQQSEVFRETISNGTVQPINDGEESVSHEDLNTTVAKTVITAEINGTYCRSPNDSTVERQIKERNDVDGIILLKRQTSLPGQIKKDGIKSQTYELDVRKKSNMYDSLGLASPKKSSRLAWKQNMQKQYLPDASVGLVEKEPGLTNHAFMDIEDEKVQSPDTNYKGEITKETSTELSVAVGESQSAITDDNSTKQTLYLYPHRSYKETYDTQSKDDNRQYIDVETNSEWSIKLKQEEQSVFGNTGEKYIEDKKETVSRNTGEEHLEDRKQTISKITYEEYVGDLKYSNADISSILSSEADGPYGIVDDGDVAVAIDDDDSKHEIKIMETDNYLINDVNIIGQHIIGSVNTEHVVQTHNKNVSDVIKYSNKESTEIQQANKDRESSTDTSIGEYDAKYNRQYRNQDQRDATSESKTRENILSRKGYLPDKMEIVVYEQLDNGVLQSFSGKDMNMTGDVECSQTITHDAGASLSKSHDTSASVSKSYDTGASLSNSHDTIASVAKSHDTNASVSKPHDTGASLSKSHDTSASVSKSHDTGASLSKLHDTSASISKPHGTGVSLSKSHDIDVFLSKSQDTGASVSNSHDTSASVSKLHGTSVSVSKSHATGAFLSKSHDTSVSVSKSHDTSASVSKSYVTGAFLSKSHDTSASVSKSHDTGVSLSKLHDTSTSVSKSHDTSASASKSHDTGASLSKSHDTSASLSKSHDTSASLSNSHNTGVSLSNSHNTGASLSKLHDTSASVSKSHDTGTSLSESHDTGNTVSNSNDMLFSLQNEACLRSVSDLRRSGSEVEEYIQSIGRGRVIGTYPEASTSV